MRLLTLSLILTLCFKAQLINDFPYRHKDDKNNKICLCNVLVLYMHSSKTLNSTSLWLLAFPLNQEPHSTTWSCCVAFVLHFCHMQMGLYAMGLHQKDLKAADQNFKLKQIDFVDQWLDVLTRVPLLYLSSMA